MSSLKKQALRGTIWTIAGYGASQVLRLGGNLILTRLLEPKLFGLMALVYVFITGLHLFSDLGLGASIIQNKRGDDPEFLNTAWTLQVVRGGILWLGSVLLAWPVAQFYNEPQFLWLIPVVALTALISGFDATAIFTLNRHMDVRQVSLYELGRQVITLSVTIGWATFDHSIRALVAGAIATDVIALVWTHRMIPGMSNRFAWDKEAVKELVSFGKWIFLSTAVTFFAEQADRLILGKLIPFEVLGIYGVALTFADLPRNVTNAISGKVIFPALSRMNNLPPSEIRAKLRRNRRMILLALAVGLTVLAGFGDYLVKFLYDERYSQATWMLPILALGIWPRMLCNTNEPALMAIGKPQYATIAQVTRVVFTSVGVLLGFHLYKIPGAIIAVALNDLFYYTAVNYGLWREGLSGLREDILATLLLVVLLAVVLFSRSALGLGLPINGLLLAR